VADGTSARGERSSPQRQAADQNDAALGRQTGSKCELTEILVERHDDPLSRSARVSTIESAAARIDSLTHNTSCPRFLGAITIGPGTFSFARKRTRLVSVGQTGLNVLGGEVIVLLPNLLGRVTSRQKLQDELHGDARTFDYRLSDEHILVGTDSIAPVHVSSDLRSNPA